MSEMWPRGHRMGQLEAAISGLHVAEDNVQDELLNQVQTLLPAHDGGLGIRAPTATPRGRVT